MLAWKYLRCILTLGSYKEQKHVSSSSLVTLQHGKTALQDVIKLKPGFLSNNVS